MVAQRAGPAAPADSARSTSRLRPHGAHAPFRTIRSAPLRPVPDRRGTDSMTDLPRLSVVVPVYNEKATVRIIVDRLRAIPLPMEIITVNDFSTDGSGEILAPPDAQHL